MNTIKIETAINNGTDPFHHPLYDHRLIKEEAELLVDPVELMAKVGAVAADHGIYVAMSHTSQFVTELCCINQHKVKAIFGGIVFSFKKDNPQFPREKPVEATGQVWEEFSAAFDFFKELLEEKDGTAEKLCHALNALMVMTICAGKDETIARWTCSVQNNEFFDAAEMMLLVKEEYHPAITQAGVWVNGMRTK